MVQKNIFKKSKKKRKNIKINLRISENKRIFVSVRCIDYLKFIRN